MIATSSIGARRASTGNIEPAPSMPSIAQVKCVGQSQEMLRTRSLSLGDAESYMSAMARQKVFPTPNKVEFDYARAFLAKRTVKVLDRFLSYFIDEYTIPQNSNTAKPVVKLWLDKLDPILPSGNPIRRKCTAFVEDLDQKFDISRRLISASDYRFIDKIGKNERFGAESFITTVLTEFADLHSVSDLDEALSKDPLASFESALQKCFLYIFVKYNAKLSDQVKVQGKKLINAFLFEAPDVLKNMFDEAKLELGYDEVVEFNKPNPSLEDLIDMHAHTNLNK